MSLPILFLWQNKILKLHFCYSLNLLVYVPYPYSVKWKTQTHPISSQYYRKTAFQV